MEESTAGGPRSTVLFEISSLSLDGSPRLSGEDVAHTRMLAEVDDELPPILVHRQTMRVIDGVHRVKAVLLRGQRTIAGTFFDGDAEAAFARAVAANVVHGLPLSLADRHAAAARIVTAMPTWSDRAIAASTGLSARTIRGIRMRSTAGVPQSNSRVGRDGRVRPLNLADGRRRAAEVIENRPEATLREIASAAGISVGTARDVRNRIRNGEDPVPVNVRRNEQQWNEVGDASEIVVKLNSARQRDASEILNALKNDPSIRYSNTGRDLVRWLVSRMISAGSWNTMVDSIPNHCMPTVAEFAAECASVWWELAAELEVRAKEAGVGA